MRVPLACLAALAAAACAAAIPVGLIGSRSYAAAIVGKSHSFAVAKPAENVDALDELKAAYRRPTTIPFPSDDPYTRAKALLGKELFYDPRMSASNLLACATCHNPALGWSDGQPKAVGNNMNILGRRTPSLFNLAWEQTFTWDGHAATLEEQALQPIQSPTEMNLPLDRLLERLSAIAEYRAHFAAAFPQGGITADAVAKAIATYERTIVSGWAPFDRWIAGDSKALTEAEIRGFVAFNTNAHCAQCHRGWNFTDDSFHDIGLASADIGRGRLLPGIVTMQQAFKTPCLREISRHGPYMHDGSLATLEQVVEHYDRGGVSRPSRSSLIKPLGLSAQEKSDLVAFMGTLSSRIEPITIPSLPRQAADTR